MSRLRNRLITRAVETFGLNSDDEYRNAAAFVDEMIAATLKDNAAERDAGDTDIASIVFQITALGWEPRIDDTPDPYERDDYYDAEARRIGCRRWTRLSPSDHVQARGETRREAAVRLLDGVRQKNAARERLDAMP